MSILLYYGDLDISDEINYKIDLNGFKAPEPTVKQQYADSALRHGQLPTEAWKYNNRILDFTIQVFGSTPAELDTNIKILEYTVCVAGAVVTYCPNGRTTNIYFNAFRPEEVDPSTYFERTYQQANMAIIRWSVQAYPFGYTDRRYLYPCRSLGLNDSFEKRDGNDFEHWYEAASGFGTITANTTGYLKGGVSCKMTTRGESDTCPIWDEDYLTVNELHAHNAKLFAYKNSGTLSLDYDLHCYGLGGYTSCSFPTASLGITPGLPVTIVCVVNKASAWDDGLIHLMYINMGGPGGGYIEGFEVLAAYGMICVIQWHGTDTHIRGIYIDETNWSANVDHRIVAIIDADANARIFADGVEGFLDFGSVTGRETAVGTNSYFGVHYDEFYTIGGTELSAIFDGTATDAEVASISAMTDWATLPGLTAATPLLLFDGTDAIYDSVHNIPATMTGTPTTDTLMGVTAPVIIGGNASLLDTLPLLTAYNPAATTWMDVLKVAGSPVVYPSDSTLSPCFPVGTMRVKREIRHDTTIGEVSLDSLLFEDADLIQGNELEGTFVINIPADTSSGDVPADARITVGSAYCSGPWSPQVSGATRHLYGISVLDASHVWAVGNYGKLLFYNGLTWTPQASGVIKTLRAVAAHDATTAWAVGDDGTLLFWNGTTWAASVWSTLDFYGICAITASNVVIVGEAGFISVGGVEKTSGTTYDLRAVDAADASHIWAVGDHGTMLFSSNGTTWTLLANRTTVNLRAVCALDSTHVWVVGESGRILFYNGTNWVRQTSPTSQHLLGVYAYDSTHVWAVGTSGTILFYNGIVWAVQGSGTSQHLRQVGGVSATSVWAVGDYGTIIHGVAGVGVMPMTNLDIGERDIQYAENFAAVQDAAGTTQVQSVYRHGQYFRSVAGGGTHKFRYPVGSHRGRYILSIGASWSSTTTYDQLRIKLYLETADGIKISPTDISLTPLDLDNQAGLFKETAFATAGARLIDIDIPSHYVSPNANEDNIYQVIEVTNNAASTEWLDCCTLLPAERCVELSSMAANFLIFDSEVGEVLSSQDGSFDTAAVYDPTKTVDSPRFMIDPRGSSFVVLAGNIVAGNERLSPLLDIEISWEPQWLMIPGPSEIPPGA